MGTSPTSRGSVPRQPSLGFDEQLERIAALIRLAGGEALSVRAFNRLRAAHDPALPTAQAACSRFGLSWADVRQLAATPASARGAFHGVRTSGRADYVFDREDALVTLRSVAHVLGKTPDRREYDAEVERRINRSKRGGLPPAALPHSQTIANNLGGWTEALIAAGLAPRGKTFGTGHTNPARRSAVDLVDAFVSEHEVLPQRHYFEDWCRATDTTLGRDSRDWRAVVAGVREKRAARGEPTPEKLSPRSACPPIPEAVKGGNRRAKRVTREQVIASLQLYAKRHAKGQRVTSRDYGARALADPDLIHPNTIQRFGKWGDLRREAGI